MDTLGKLRLLSADSQYDLACSCGTQDPRDHRKRGAEGKWLYTVKRILKQRAAARIRSPEDFSLRGKARELVGGYCDFS